MSNLTQYPLEDAYESTLAQEYNWAIGTVYVNTSPTFTFPSWVTCFLVINPTKTNMQIVEVDSYNSSLNTFNVTNITLEKWASINSTAQTHAVNSKVIISDNYAFWSAIKIAINSKLDNDADWTWDAATDFAGITAKSLTTAQRTALTWVNGMIVLDTDLGVLYQYIWWAWSTFATWTTSNASETVAGKIELPTDAEVTAQSATWWTWATVCPTNVQTWKSVSLKAVGATLAETDHLVFDNAWVDNKMLVSVFRDQLAASETIKGTVERATDTEALAGTDTTKYVTPAQIDYTPISWTEHTVWTANTERISTALSYTLKKEIAISKAWVFSTTMDLKASGWTPSMKWRIYVNGSAVWTIHGGTSTSYNTYTDASITVAAWDLVQVYLLAEAGWWTAYVRNFQIKCIRDYWIATVNTD